MIDRSGWGPGPWDDEPDELWFEHAGLQCLVLRQSYGHLCGYVRVPEAHVLHGMDHSSRIRWDQEEDVELAYHDIEQLIARIGVTGEDMGPRLKVVVQVHGSLTYAGPLRDEEGWWFGFSCDHNRDRCPSLPSNMVAPCDVYRDFSYVEHQCRQLAEQLAEIKTLAEAVTPEQAMERRLKLLAKIRAATPEQEDADA